MSDFDRGDRVSNTSSVGGLLGGSVPEGTEGRITETRYGLFDSYATVEFDNGYKEEVRTDQLKRESGWF